MRARKRIGNLWLLTLLALTVLLASCSSADDNNSVQINDYCYIKSATLGNVTRKVELYDRQGNLINTRYATFTGSSYPMTVDLRAGTIENRNPLPFGSQLSAVTVTIAFDGSLLRYRVKGSDADWKAYNATDSLDLTRPLELLLTSNDGQSSRTYTFTVHVHSQEGDSLYWNRCESEVAQLDGMTDMKAFTLADRLLVLGKKNTEGTDKVVLAGRTSIEAEGTWEEIPTTGLPVEADLQSLCQHDGILYLSTSDGSILSSIDAQTWQQVGIPHSAALTLFERTDDYFYAYSEGKLLRSADATTWDEEKLDSEPDKLPVYGIRALTMQQPNGNSRIVMVGQNDNYTNALVWNKMWNENEAEEDAEWMFFPLSPDNAIPCPRLNHFNLLEYDDKCIAFGGASADGKRKALDGIYVSQDYGITWRPSTEIHMPIELEGIEGCIASTVDTNNYIWIITNAQVWRGRLNRLGFAQQ